VHVTDAAFYDKIIHANGIVWEQEEGSVSAYAGSNGYNSGSLKLAVERDVPFQCEGRGQWACQVKKIGVVVID
jgi:hypothetical protein